MKKFKHKILKNPSDKELLKQLNDGWELFTTYQLEVNNIMYGTSYMDGINFLLRKSLNDNCKCEMVAYIKEMDK